MNKNKKVDITEEEQAQTEKISFYTKRTYVYIRQIIRAQEERHQLWLEARKRLEENNQ